MTQHEYGCRHEGQHSDAAKRLADAYNLHYEAGALYGATNVGKWIAAKLDDGRTDNTVYDSKYDAVMHQHHDEQYYTFVRIIPSSMSVCAAEAMLRMGRLYFDYQMKTADRDSRSGGFEIIPRLSIEDQLLQEQLIASRAGTIAIGNAE